MMISDYPDIEIAVNVPTMTNGVELYDWEPGPPNKGFSMTMFYHFPNIGFGSAAAEVRQVQDPCGDDAWEGEARACNGEVMLAGSWPCLSLALRSLQEEVEGYLARMRKT